MGCVASPPHRQPAAGQSSIEYVGLLALVAVALAAAAPAAGLPDVGVELARAVRTGVCIVGGDYCRPADARAAGLDPCTLTEHRSGAGAALTVGTFRLGEKGQMTIARRSDGSVAISLDAAHRAGVVGTVGLAAGPVRLSAGGELALTVAAARGWEFPDEATARRFVAEIPHGSPLDDRRWPRAWQSGDGGLATGAAGKARLGGNLATGHSVAATGAAIETSAEAALGVRVGGGRTTYYLRVGALGPSARWGGRRQITLGGTAAPSLAEYTRDADGPLELAFRGVTRGDRPGQVVESVARMDLRDPVNLSVAWPLLSHPAPWPPSLFAAMRDVIGYAVAVGTVEQSVYAVTDRSHDIDVSIGLGAGLGLRAERIDVDRRLVSAMAMIHGSAPRAREDCVQSR